MTALDAPGRRSCPPSLRTPDPIANEASIGILPAGQELLIVVLRYLYRPTRLEVVPPDERRFEVDVHNSSVIA
ncbi:hypothetical protein K1T35_47470 (plasmid) [Pseudonocardia sp. DSM 110487]|uniref:hypothetical protein n=1 Tax=Pseudonocardia sp. DSM 110487 TaxID=2865833 RepID=UPI001C6A7E66|nr:hypothetical protein [Pseudonocardia sp. DSM 110487]QYN40990.1 hypothetical protein K1T35_47470 [Pseudonocardia sp. DSM 110487]